MTLTNTKRPRLNLGKVLLAAFLILLLFGLVVAAVELVRPGLLRGKLYTAYFVAKAKTWEWEYKSGVPDTRALDRVVMAVLAPDIARMPARTWHMPSPESFEEPLSQDAIAQAPFSPPGAEWKYLDEGSNLDGDWHTLNFDDSTWQTTSAPLAFTTEIASTQNPDGAASTRYLRREFLVEDPSIYGLLDLELLWGGEARVYLNSNTLFHHNQAAAVDRTQTSALEPSENLYFHQTLDAVSLQPGRNVLAVELHLNGAAHPEDRFDLTLHGALWPASARFAVIGDYGTGGKHARAVADLVKSWEPSFIITTGDNNYSSGEARTIDKNVGQFYHDFIYPYYGRYGPGADRNRFFPTMGNHEWSDNNYVPSPPNAYLNYFTLPPGPGNERYYDFQWGPVHFFALDSDINEPDGITSDSIQGRWLQTRLQESLAPWKLVYMHHPPFASSDIHPPIEEINWPFPEWGASLVMSGHNHFYERFEHDNIPYFINGTGGGELYDFGTPDPGSQARFTGEYGAMLVQAGPCRMHIWFITIDGAVIDRYQLAHAAPACQ